MRVRVGCTGASTLFAVTNGTTCAESLPYGPATITESSSPYLSTAHKHALHSQCRLHLRRLGFLRRGRSLGACLLRRSLGLRQSGGLVLVLGAQSAGLLELGWGGGEGAQHRRLPLCLQVEFRPPML